MDARSRIASAVLGLCFAAGAAASCVNDGSGPVLDCAPAGKVECQINCSKPFPWSGTQCDSYCVDIQSDSENCGHCGLVCPPAHVCSAAKCVTECGPFDSLCAVDGGPRRCVDTTSDNENCGGCGTACRPGFICLAGACITSCGPSSLGQTLCATDGGPPYCANLANDNDSCGRCGHACAPGEFCEHGICQSWACGPGQASCGGDAGAYCANLQSDQANCGLCGKKCGSQESCSQSHCTSPCTEYQTLCTADGGAPFCANTFSDNANCGTCGKVCPSSKPMCAGGVCNDGSCGTSALVLGDGNAASNAAYQTLLKGMGYTVTLLTTGAISYAGSPVASNFGVVIVTPGLNYSTDMPAAGQNAIVAAQVGGTGVIFTEWSTIEVQNGHYAALSPLLAFPHGSLVISTLTFTLVAPGHPIWNGLPTTFTTTVSLGANVTSTLNVGAKEIASCSECAGGIGVAVEDPSTAGRIVQIGHAAGYKDWYTDTNLTRMMGNAALWASRCD